MATSDLPPPVISGYQSGGLCNLLTSAAAAMGVPGFVNSLNLPSAQRICLLLIDGLGAQLLANNANYAPTLTRLAATGRQLTAGFPSTTSVSLTSLSTGLPPGEHGMVGYRMRVPGTDTVLHSLRWDQEVDPVVWQPHPTVFDAVVAHGIAGYYVSAGVFRESGLTRAAWRGATYIPTETPGQLVATTAAILHNAPRALLYAYYPELDRTGHVAGANSASWSTQLAIIDRMVELLLAAVPSDTLLLITGDHGMVDVPFDLRVDIDTPANLLSEGVALFSGEDRVRYLHTIPGASQDVLATWRELVGNRAWVVSRAQAIEEKWFGPRVANHVVERIGDIIVAAGPQFAVHGSVREPRKSLPLGLHGSMTATEQFVPLLLVKPG